MKLLLEHNARVDRRDRCGRTALMLACDNGHTEAVKMLSEHRGCDHVNLQDNNGSSALIDASKKKQMEVIKILLKNGANLDLRDVHGRTALSYASENTDCEAVEFENDRDDFSSLHSAQAARIFRDIEIMRCLLEGGAQVDLQDNFGRSPLLIASERGLSTLASNGGLARWRRQISAYDIVST